VNNNSGFGQTITGISNAYGADPGRREEAYGFGTMNFADIARDMGCLGIRVESPDAISAALKEALAADAPVVVDVVTDITCKPPSPWSPPSE
jgi:acetolactate synthase-1/2/3 large subunit